MCFLSCRHSQWNLNITKEVIAEGMCVSPLRMSQGEGQLLGESSRLEYCWKSRAAIVYGRHVDLPQASRQGRERSEKLLWLPRGKCKRCWTRQIDLKEPESGSWGCRRREVRVETWTTGTDAGSGPCGKSCPSVEAGVDRASWCAAHCFPLPPKPGWRKSSNLQMH